MSILESVGLLAGFVVIVLAVRWAANKVFKDQ